MLVGFSSGGNADSRLGRAVPWPGWCKERVSVHVSVHVWGALHPEIRFRLLLCRPRFVARIASSSRHWVCGCIDTRWE